MAVINLIDKSFFKELEKDVITSIGVSLTKNGKVVTARTIKSVRAVTIFSGETAEVQGFGGEGLPHIISGKPANTKYPLDYKGTKTGKRGKPIKVFELKPRLRDWKAVIGFGGSDFMLARAIAKNPREAVNIAVLAITYLEKKTTPKVLRQYSKLFAVEIVNNFDNAERTN